MPFVDRDLAGENGRAAAVAFFEDLVEVSAGASVRNSSLAPNRPGSRSRLSLRMRLRWANSISTFFRSRRGWRYSGVPAKPLATSRAASCTLLGTLRRGCPGQHLALRAHASQS